MGYTGLEYVDAWQNYRHALKKNAMRGKELSKHGDSSTTGLQPK